MKYPILLVLTLLFLVPIASAADPWEGYVTESVSGEAPLTVNFTDISYNSPTAWNWSFRDVTGNNTEIWFSQLQNPSYTFNVGNFSIRLNASNSWGFNITPALVFVNVSGNATMPIAYFTSNSTSGVGTATIAFTDLSSYSPTAWNWTFQNVTGNNTLVTFSTSQNPTKTFGVGNFSIKLNVSNAAGSNTTPGAYFINVTQSPPLATFTSNVTDGLVPLAVQFNDTSAMGLSGERISNGGFETGDFGAWSPLNGAVVSTTTPHSGSYSVHLPHNHEAVGSSISQSVDLTGVSQITFWGAGGADPVILWVDGVQVGAITNGTYGLNRVNLSYSGVHTLKIGVGFSGTGTHYLDDISAISIGTGLPVAWNWSFRNVTGNNTEVWFSQERNSTYTFGVGNFSIKLNASNSAGYNISPATYFINVSSATVAPAANFSANVTSGTAPLAVSFTDSSTNVTSAWNWSFRNVTGNNTEVWFSQSQNPTITFGVGNFSIKLNASNAAGYNITPGTYFINVSVLVVSPVSRFTSNISSGPAPLPVQFNDTTQGTPAGERVVNGGFESGTVSTIPGWTGTSGIIVSNPAYVHSGSQATFLSYFGAPFSQTLDLTGVSRVTFWHLGYPIYMYVDGTLLLTTGIDSAYAQHIVDVSSYSGNHTLSFAALTDTPASFYIDDVSAVAVDMGTPTSWNWSFTNITPGNNTEIWWSQERNATYTFGVGNWSIKLNSSNSVGYNVTPGLFIITSGLMPTPGFTGAPLTGPYPLTVTFTDSSVDATSWAWDFNNDGVNDSTARSPTYTYLYSGTYSVKQYVTNSVGSTSLLRDGYVTVGGAPNAVDFSGTPRSGEAPLIVAFTGSAIGTAPLSWNWSFGDGTYSSIQNPAHEYTSNGVYTVSLTVTNAYGTDTETKAAYIDVNQLLPVVDFTASPTEGFTPLTVTFTGSGTGILPYSWYWSFGDGTSSTLQSPTHTYTNTGTNTVTVTLTNAHGTSTKSATITVWPVSGGGTTPGTCSDIITDAATNASTRGVQLNGHVSSNATEYVWFVYGLASNTYSVTTTNRSTPLSGNFSEVVTLGLYSNKRLYFRAASGCGYGAEESILIPTVTMLPTPTFGEHYDTIVESKMDPGKLAQEIPRAFTQQMGASEETGTLIFWGFIIMCVFIVLYLRSENVTTPALLGMIIGWVIMQYVPGEFKLAGEALLVVALAAMGFMIVKGRIR